MLINAFYHPPTKPPMRQHLTRLLQVAKKESQIVKLLYAFCNNFRNPQQL